MWACNFLGGMLSKVIRVVSCESKGSLLLCTLKVLLTCAVCCDVSICMMMVVCHVSRLLYDEVCV